MLDNQFIEESLTEALKALDKHIRANDDVYKRDIENGLSIMLDDLKDIEGIAYINISYLYSNVLSNRTELLVTAYGEDWYVEKVLYEREIQFGDFFSVLKSVEDVLLLEIKKSLGKINESIIQKISLDCIRIIGKVVEQLFRNAIRSPEFYKSLEDMGVNDKERHFMILFGEYLDHSEPLYINKKESMAIKDILYGFDRHEPSTDSSYTGVAFKNHPIEDVDFSDTWFHQCSFEKSELKGLYLFNTTFNQCVFKEISFDECTLLSTMFHECEFIDCNFESINSRLELRPGLTESSLHQKTAFVDCQYKGMAVDLIEYLGA